MLAASPEVTLGDLRNPPERVGMTSAALRIGIGLDPCGILVRVGGKAIAAPAGETRYLVCDGGTPFTVLPEGVSRPGEGEFNAFIPSQRLSDSQPSHSRPTTREQHLTEIYQRFPCKRAYLSYMYMEDK